MGFQDLNSCRAQDKGQSCWYSVDRINPPSERKPLIRMVCPHGHADLGSSPAAVPLAPGQRDGHSALSPSWFHGCDIGHNKLPHQAV